MVYNVIGNKGGIGKTTISAYFAEYLKSNNKRKVICIDTDPENLSFMRYESLNVVNIQLKDENEQINRNAFDEMIDLILNNKDADIIIDNGASSFNPLINYLKENQIIELLKDENVEHKIIGIVAGGGNTIDSINGLNTIISNFDTPFIVINNQLIASTVVDGKELQETKTIKSNQHKIEAIVEIDTKEGYVLDEIMNFTKERILFADLNSSENYKMMHKRRLFSYREDFFQQLEEIENNEIEDEEDEVN